MRTLLPLLLLCLVTLAPGCGLLGVVAGRTLPEPKVPAAFDLGEGPVAVEVTADESTMGEAAMLDADPVAVTIRRQLEAEAELEVLSDGTAERLVRVDLTDAGTAGVIGGPYADASAAAHVRVLDAGGRELWPADGTPGRLVTAELPPTNDVRPRDARRAVLVRLGERAAELFHPHPPDPLDIDG